MLGSCRRFSSAEWHSRSRPVIDRRSAGSARWIEAKFFDARDLVQVRYEMVRRARIDGDTVSSAASAFGFSRPSWYAAASALDEGGLPGLMPARPGPRRAHKLTEEVVAFLLAATDEDPQPRSTDLAARVEDAFGLSVHPRSIERALERARRPKSRRGRRGQR